jgi:hypothetical protein
MSLLHRDRFNLTVGTEESQSIKTCAGHQNARYWENGENIGEGSFPLTPTLSLGGEREI